MKVPWRRLTGVALVVAAAGSVTMSYLSTTAHQRYVECQATINDALINRTRVLTEAADQERRAQRAADDAERLLFTDPAVAKPMRERSEAEQARITELFRGYQAALTNLDVERREADAARARNPVPSPPSATCSI